MKKKGQALLYGLMIATTLLVLGLALASPLQSFIENARNTTQTDGSAGLDCNNDTISDFDKGTCVITDITLPYFIGIVFGIAFVVIGARFAIGGNDE